MMQESKEGIFCIRASLLETDGSIDYLKKHSLYSINRGTSITIETAIEKLIEFGYHHAHYLGELGTYRRE